MEILDKKSTEITSFFTALDEMLDSIGQALKNRTPHLNGEKLLTNKDVCGILHVSSRTIGGIQERFRLFGLKGRYCIGNRRF
jgi:hypothetical protein